MKLPRITEPDEGLVHYKAWASADQVTLCGLTDFIGHKKRGAATKAKVTCISCKQIVEYIRDHDAPATSDYAERSRK